MHQHTVLFPGTFDPITNGHLDLIQRASQLFDQIIIAVSNNPLDKTPVFNLEQRIFLIQETIKNINNAKVVSYDGLTIICAQQHKAQALLRGLRSGHDLPLEQQMAAMNRHLAPEIDTIFLPTASQYLHISASLVRQIAQLKGDVSQLVPAHVAVALQKRFFP